MLIYIFQEIQLSKCSKSLSMFDPQLTVVDLMAFDVLEHVVDVMGIQYLDKFPKVKANFQHVSDLPAIKKYVANRPPHSEAFEF